MGYHDGAVDVEDSVWGDFRSWRAVDISSWFNSDDDLH